MGRKIITIKTLVLSSIILVSTLLLSLYSVLIFNKPTNYFSSADARIILNNSIFDLQNGNSTSIDKYTYSIFDLNGNVIKSNNPNYPLGSAIDLKTLSGINHNKVNNTITYTAPYIKDNSQIGTIVVNLDYDTTYKINPLYYTPIIIFTLIIITAVLYLINFLNKDILNPISQIHNSAINIIKGNLDKRIHYDYDGAIGELCHDFEALRVNLNFSIENEKKLKDKEKLLLAYISHDLKTPIATIYGYAEAINYGIVKDEKSIKENTDIILKKATMLTNLIDDILTISKTQLNEFSISKEECYSLDFFSEVLSEAKKDVESHNISFHFNEIPNIIINIDKIRIKQVMQNLINNAIKFTKDSGEIKVHFDIHEHNMLISVIDNGIGIAATDLPMIFHEFYRSEKARTLNLPGSGLGLSISKYIIEKHNGEIECDSILNFGTTITFSLPF